MMRRPCRRPKKVLQVIAHLTDHCAATGTELTAQAQQLHHDLAKIMRRFGRQCRGQGKVFVRLVRQTEKQLLATGHQVVGLARAAPAHVQSAAQLAAAQRPRLDIQLQVALTAHQQIAPQSRRLTTGKPLPHCKIVNAYDRTIAPICKGKSNCPTQFGRKPGIIAEPASGFIFGFELPVGNPADPSSVVPLIAKVQYALEQVSGHPMPAIPSLAGDLALNDPKLREALHSRGILTVGIPYTVEPLPPVPTPEDIRQMLTKAGLNHRRPPHQVQIACACGYSRPIVESLIASLLGRGAGCLTYKGHRGATVQMGMIVMAHNAATVARISQGRLSKRAQKLRRVLRLQRHNINQFNASKN
jgi:hypothetical protein